VVVPARILAIVLLALVAGGASAAAPQPRLYSATSPLNVPIPKNARIDPRSRAMVSRMVADLKGGKWPVAAGEWTQPVYFVDGSTRRLAVRLTHEGYENKRLYGVPIPDYARASNDSDAALVVIDRSTGCEYDLIGAAKGADGEWTARFANALRIGGRGIYPYAESPRASGFANAAGVILADELASGHIDHALAFVMQHTKAGGPVRPASGSDGWSHDPGAVPEGARVQLDPKLDLAKLGLDPWERTIARALQRYGMYLVDTGGVLGLQAQHRFSTETGYAWGDEVYGALPVVLAQHLRVLKLGPQFKTVYRFVPNPCATLR
jgi:hypothetical protein